MRAISILTLGLLLVACSIFTFSTANSQIVLGVSVNVEPPPLPVYEQPPIPEPGYMWTPGYWAWDDDTGYYWVPGTWVLPPEPALLWTPGYWGWNDGVYAFHEGYWGPEVGFYGGVSYGFGYTGAGYEGGYWRDGNFFYNRTVNNISNVQINNVYNKTVVVNNTTNVSYNGGTGGTTARATPEQIAAANQQHVPPTEAQTHNMQAAAKDPSLSLNNNQGHPAVAATAHPAEFKGPGVIAAQPGKPVAAVSPQGHTVSSPALGRTVNTPGANVGPAAATRGNPPAVAPNNATKDLGNKGGPSTTVVSPNRPEIKEHTGTPSGGQSPSPGPTTQPKQLPTTAARPTTPEAARPTPPPPPHAVAPAPPPPPHATEPAPPHPAASAAPPRPAAPPPRPASPAAKPKCPPGDKC
jgi:WXXGXW repeat (2 copies)